MYWEIVPTPQGCQLFVDGSPIGSDAEPPPSGWLQRQYGILMPPEYEQIRLMCGVPENACETRTPPFADTFMRDGDCVWIPGRGWVTLPLQPPMRSPIAGVRRATIPSRSRKCYSKVTPKGLWVCCQGTCKLAVRTPM